MAWYNVKGQKGSGTHFVLMLKPVKGRYCIAASTTSVDFEKAFQAQKVDI